MTAAPSANIVDQFRQALEFCENAHKQTTDTTPCVAPRSVRVSFSEPQCEPSGVLPNALSNPVQPPYIPNIPITTSAIPTNIVQNAAPPTTQNIVEIPTSQVSVPKPTRMTTPKIILYILLAGAIAAVAIYVRRRFISPALQRISGPSEQHGSPDEEDAISTRVAKERRSRIAENLGKRQSNQNALSEMSAYFRKQNTEEQDLQPSHVSNSAHTMSAKTEDHQKQVPQVQATLGKVDLRKVRFQSDEKNPTIQKEAPSTTPTTFFELEEEDPNFVPL